MGNQSKILQKLSITYNIPITQRRHQKQGRNRICDFGSFTYFVTRPNLDPFELRVSLRYFVSAKKFFSSITLSLRKETGICWKKLKLKLISMHSELSWETDWRNKGSHPFPIVQFFLTLFKQPLTPPPSFWTCMLQFFLKCVNVCRDKIMRTYVEKMSNLP